MKKFSIQDIMTPTEACERWDITPEKFRKTIERDSEKVDDLIRQGLIKAYQKTPTSRKKWLVSPDAMNQLFRIGSD